MGHLGFLAVCVDPALKAYLQSRHLIVEIGLIGDQVWTQVKLIYTLSQYCCNCFDIVAEPPWPLALALGTSNLCDTIFPMEQGCFLFLLEIFLLLNWGSFLLMGSDSSFNLLSGIKLGRVFC